MANCDLEIGSMVKLSETTRWIVGKDNPCGIEGILTGDDGDGWVGVMWGNGIHNKYRPNDDDLVLVEVE